MGSLPLSGPQLSGQREHPPSLTAGGGRHRLLARWSGSLEDPLVTGHQRAYTLSDAVSSLMSWTRRAIPARDEEITALANNILLQLAREKTGAGARSSGICSFCV